MSTAWKEISCGKGFKSCSEENNYKRQIGNQKAGQHQDGKPREGSYKQ